MSTEASNPQSATAQHYAAVAATYGANWGDGPEGSYPANRIRWQIVTDQLKRHNIRDVLEAGCGEGSPMAHLEKELGENAFVLGFDASPEMIAEAKKKLGPQVWNGDICNPEAFLGDGGITEYEAVVALGPFPHLTDEQQAKALANCANALDTGGRLFVEYRNELFAFFTLNRYSWDLFSEKLLRDAPARVKAAVRPYFNLFAGHLSQQDATSYGSTFSRLNNPLQAPEQLAATGLHLVKIWPYHFHACPPMYAHVEPEWFRKASLAMEYPAEAGPYALFQASAYVVEAVKV